MSYKQTRIGITLGDPAGVGPEITAKAIQAMPPDVRVRTVVIGAPETFARACRLIGFDVHMVGADADASDGKAVCVADIAAEGPAPDGKLSAEGGEAAFRAVKRGVELATGGAIGCIVTAPLNKAALHLAGHDYDGHTGLLAHLTGQKSGYMLLASEKLNTIHVSTHVSLEEATRRASKERVLAVVSAAIEHFKGLGMAAPRVAVAGLNPHCGEGGIFGRQEIETIAPAVEAARERGWNVAGPISGDTYSTVRRAASLTLWSRNTMIRATSRSS